MVTTCESSLICFGLFDVTLRWRAVSATAEVILETPTTTIALSIGISLSHSIFSLVMLIRVSTSV